MRRDKKGNPARVDTWPRRDVSTNYAGSTKVAARRLPISMRLRRSMALLKTQVLTRKCHASWLKLLLKTVVWHWEISILGVD